MSSIAIAFSLTQYRALAAWLFDTIELTMEGQHWIARNIGSHAASALDSAHAGKLLGLTSRGAFIALETSGPVSDIVFITSQPEHGPLTVNIADLDWPPDWLVPGTELRVLHEIIEFKGLPFLVDLRRANVWNPPHPAAYLLSANKIAAILQRVTLEISTHAPGPDSLVDFIRPGYLPNHPVAQAAANLAESLSARYFSQAVEPALRLLGYGSGLTPSGDDLLVGLLLCLSRFGSVIFPGCELGGLANQVCLAAQTRTTALSTGLLRAAAKGSADERLIFALDGLLTGSLEEVQISSLLKSYGASSGADTLAGFSLVINAALINQKEA